MADITSLEDTVAIREYFNQKAPVWDEAIAEKDTAKLEQMAGRLDIEPGATLLDVGTGTGVFLPFLLSRIGVNGWIVALDFAEEMLKKARAKNYNGNIDYICTDVTDIPLAGEMFDVVVCYSSFPHFQDKLKALTELHRVMRGGGRLLICHTSGRKQINEIHRQIPTVQNDVIHGETEMQLMLTEAGFADIEIEDDSTSYLCKAKKRQGR